jgi:hypothetical protein
MPPEKEGQMFRHSRQAFCVQRSTFCRFKNAERWTRNHNGAGNGIRTRDPQLGRLML